MKTQLWKHQTFLLLFLFQVQVSDLDDSSRPATDICATHTILSGPKGDEGKKGDSGEMGRQGKVGPTGTKGSKGVVGETGDHGPMGKIGPIGKKGDKGLKGLSGTSGEKGKAGAVCDCGRYRKVIGQLDITVARLKSSMNFVKNVLAGIRETEEKYYYIVQEEKSYREALTHCRIRDGILAMPKDEAANAVISDYISCTLTVPRCRTTATGRKGSPMIPPDRRTVWKC
ncbi:collectin-10 isoform X2 [Sphaerodactylus townsendi]|uniref:collectin-10 isoform X2 n=1 Tax=Sphaerodactylus townsendi TaxID=933632 RepID=UPI0020264B67|nr:collectin-10 isoform X2 [Sphaerodactylus townsendi]